MSFSSVLSSVSRPGQFPVGDRDHTPYDRILRTVACGDSVATAGTRIRWPNQKQEYDLGEDLAMNWNLLFQLVVNGIIVGALYGVVAMSFVLIYKASQVVNFAQGAFLLIGAWVCWWLLTKYQIPFFAGMATNLVFMLVFGVALQIIVLRPLIGEPII